MSRHDDSIPLRHMLDHAEEAVAMIRNRSRPDLDRDRQFSLAVLKLVEIIGEAAFRVSQSTRDAHRQIPWDKIIGTRHRLVHGYDTVDHEVLWDIVALDIPPLIEQLRAVLGVDNKQPPAVGG